MVNQKYTYGVGSFPNLLMCDWKSTSSFPHKGRILVIPSIPIASFQVTAAPALSGPCNPQE